MATETTNYQFQKPAENEYYDVNVQNGNWDKADGKLKSLDTGKVTASGGDISNTKMASLTASTTSFPVPAAGETGKVWFGKTKKFFEDVKNWMTGVCMLGQIVNNCVTDNASLPLSAAQGKALMDLYNVLNAKQELTSIGNAINEDESKWFAVLSNLVMGNTMGILFGEIIHCTSAIPVWGEKIGHFPNMKSSYNIPVLLYDTSGNVLNGVVVKTNGDIMIYNPDYAKLNVKGRRYEFYATYLAEQQS